MLMLIIMTDTANNVSMFAPLVIILMLKLTYYNYGCQGFFIK